MAELVYVNGSFLSRDEARVSAADRGFLYGDGLFETMRVGAGRPLHLDEHLERLASGAAFLGIPCPPSGDLREAVDATIAANEVEEGSLRLTLTRGEGTGPDPVSGIKPTLVVTAKRGIPYREVSRASAVL
ncbi:MAG: aminotransferase class IV [Actinobacteria bacterium]|nr:aminotransferase class IV [Actinomycetota bacterium]